MLWEHWDNKEFRQEEEERERVFRRFSEKRRQEELREDEERIVSIYAIWRKGLIKMAEKLNEEAKMRLSLLDENQDPLKAGRFTFEYFMENTPWRFLRP